MFHSYILILIQMGVYCCFLVFLRFRYWLYWLANTLAVVYFCPGKRKLKYITNDRSLIIILSSSFVFSFKILYKH